MFGGRGKGFHGEAGEVIGNETVEGFTWWDGLELGVRISTRESLRSFSIFPSSLRLLIDHMVLDKVIKHGTIKYCKVDWFGWFI